MMKRRHLLWALLFLYKIPAAQPVSASVDKSGILIGEQIQLQLKAFFPADQQPAWFTIDTIPHFEILDKSKIDTVKVQQEIVLSQTITLTSWDSGKWIIPPFRLGAAETKAVAVKVSWALPFDPNKPYNDIKDIRDVKVKEPSNWYWYFLAIILLIVILMLLFSGEKKKEKPVSELDVNAYQKALQQIDALQHDGTADNNSKDYFVRLINIFRWYLQKGKGIQSYSKTTGDLSIQLERLHLPQDQFTVLVQTLRLSDMVKYAKYRPELQESKNALVVIRDAIVAIENKDAV